MSYNQLNISTEQAEKIMLDNYGIKGLAVALPGEIDFNFRIKIENDEGFVLKISRPEQDEAYLDFQQHLLLYVEKKNLKIRVPKVVKSKKGETVSEISDGFGNRRKVRLLGWISGRIWDDVKPQRSNLRQSLGEQCGYLTSSLSGFEHTQAHREFKWDIAQSLWTKDHIHLFDSKEKEIIASFQKIFEAGQNDYTKLRKSIVHNDANCHNVVVSNDYINPKVLAVIDYGDAINTQIINDVAITIAYAIMGQTDALEAANEVLKGYHSTFPLLEDELEYLFPCVAMRLIITVTQSAINKLKEPDNLYLLISEKPAWEVLNKWVAIDQEFAHYSFRDACGYTPHPKEKQFKKWTTKLSIQLSQLFPTVKKRDIFPLDLSVSSNWLGHEQDLNDLELFEFKLRQLQKQNLNKIIAGGYLEPRCVYTSPAYDKIGNDGTESRTIHLGVDFWLPASTPVHALFDGEVFTAVNDSGDKEYGGLVIIKHSFKEIEFYTLYGHLSVAEALKHKVGDKINKGDFIASIGNYPENGNWAPHLHFQIMLSMLDYHKDFPGVAYHSQVSVWKSLCPNPDLFFNNVLSFNELLSNRDLIAHRKMHLGRSLSLQYDVPIRMVRGAGVYLIDQFGKKYLDTVNNVAHVGHESPTVVDSGQKQMAILNTNSRYLHPIINELAQEIIETLPKELSVVHFVNSGSEANELAIRMAKAVTGEKDILVSEGGYHGNSNTCVDISSYKFDGTAGNGAPEHTHVFPIPDSFRGKYRGENTGTLYVNEVKEQINKIHKRGRNVCALIMEPIISCGGQIELPKRFLKKSYELVRQNKGVCISDEVQVGCGRLGKTFWGFQLHNVIPDIITIGKPLGNGHPVAAVVCAKEIADRFANGMEYFNTFGGNPVSCAIAKEVLKTIKRDNLQSNAFIVGGYIKAQLKEMSVDFPIIGDVRGEGLFLGFELTDNALNPLADRTKYLVNRMKDYGILMSMDGPDNNVIKIKPPLIFNLENAKVLIYYLRKVFCEDFMVSKTNPS